MADAIVLHQVTKSFGTKIAVRDLDLVVPQGALYGFIGPNGAGKTTTIRILMSILFPDRGEVQVLGHASALEAKDRIGYLPEERGLYKKMKVGAFLAYICKLKGCDGDPRSRVRRGLERVALGEVENKRCDELSKGMQQKVQLLAAVLHEPELLVLDEPFSGLDPVNARLLRDLVLEQHQRGCTILFSTHVMVHAEQLCDHIVMIHDGDKVLDAGMDQIRGSHDSRTLWFEPLDPKADVAPLRALPGVRGLSRDGASWQISLAETADPARALSEVAAAVPAVRIELRRPTLEDIFIQIVTGDAAGAAQAEALRTGLREDAATAGGHRK